MTSIRELLLRTCDKPILAAQSWRLPRRVLICHIDPKIELPHTRQFDFDPVNGTLTIVEAGVVRYVNLDIIELPIYWINCPIKFQFPTILLSCLFLLLILSN